ncbi:MAG: threonine/serine exporter family protein, partial [Actinophytocola sp.]|uniref:threonine/serine exporter family protein n=1 Tax=Actinophytocola sp. TaxID=1872138 RepID=UPI0013224C6E
AATVIGFSGGVLSRRLKIPPLVVAVSGMVPLLPGLTTYRALFELAVERSLAGLPTLMVAASVALALAAGVVLGEYLAQPVRYGLGRLERRFSGPRMAGPLRPTRRRLE